MCVWWIFNIVYVCVHSSQCKSEGVCMHDLQWRIQDFQPHEVAPTWLCFIKFVCKNERIGTLCRAPLDPPMIYCPCVCMCGCLSISIELSSVQNHQTQRFASKTPRQISVRQPYPAISDFSAAEIVESLEAMLWSVRGFSEINFDSVAACQLGRNTLPCIILLSFIICNLHCTIFFETEHLRDRECFSPE